MPEVTRDGVAFHVEQCGSGFPIVLLHGFTGSGKIWQSLTETLSNRRRVVAIDIIGHGESGVPENSARYAFDPALDDLAAIAAALNISPAAWLGYSMGARLCLGLAVRHPDLVSSLILESASPGIFDPAERVARKAADDTLAARIEEIGVPAFVAEWERLPMWSSQQHLPAETREEQRQIRLRNRAVGLAGSLRGMGAGAQDSLWERLPDISMPVLVIAGALDTKYVDLAQRMSAAMPAAELELIADVGHAVHLERPDFFAKQVSRFLTENERLAVRQNQEDHQ